MNKPVNVAARAGLVPLVVVLTACVSSTPAALQPAKLSAASTTAQCLREIETSVRSLGGPPVTLTTRAFDGSDRLAVDRANASPDGTPLDGRRMGRPEVFRLALRGGQCVMLREANNASIVLNDCNCAPMP